MMQRKTRRGFTLIEVLVVVLIIGILAAIALPMYNRAVLRSRFNALMPIVKAMNDSNEAYYLEHGSYASNPQDLPVQGQSSYPTGTELEFGSNMDYAYVLASNSSAKNNYIMYQKHSSNYPGEIHCEAITGDDLAEYICESAGGTTNLGTTLTEGYTTYVISGSGAGFAPGVDDNNGGGAEISCDAATAMGYTCNMTTNEQGKTVKQICATVGSSNICRTKTYDEDGGYISVTCQVNSEGVCTSSWYSATYDANGNQLTTRVCSSVDSSGNCTAYSYGYNYTYDANGNMLMTRQCSSVDSSGNCTVYGSGSYAANYDYTYDANGNQLTERRCSSVDSGTGNCTTYTTTLNYTYDANGNRLTYRRCSSVDSSTGNCTAYDASSSYDYTYDANGHKLTMRACNDVAADGSCNAYQSSSGNNIDYTYDANGNMISERKCNSVEPDGSCSVYASRRKEYTYDVNGNQISQRDCTTIAADESCNIYGNNTYIYVYDDSGKQIAYQYCSGSNLNTATGECTAYNSTTVSNN